MPPGASTTNTATTPTARIYIDHIAVATANLNPEDSVQEIVLAWERRDGVWDGDYHFLDWRYDFFCKIFTQITTLSVGTGTSTWSVTGFDREITADGGWVMLVNDRDPVTNYNVTGPSLGLATGDLTLDGVDEVVVSSRDWVRVYRSNQSETAPALYAHDAQFTRGYWRYNEPARRVVSIVDLDADIEPLADGSDWRPEVVMIDWDTTSHLMHLRALRATPDTQGTPSTADDTIDRFDVLASYVPGYGATNSDVALIYGDFDGDGVCFGAPSTSQTIAVSQPLVILKSPPVHFDVIDDTVYDLNECYPSAAGYQCSEFYARYTETTTGGTIVTQSAKDDFGASTTLTNSAEGSFKILTARVETSLTASVGANFSREGRRSVSQSVNEMEQTLLDGLDHVLVNTVHYKVWEYPVVRRDGIGLATKGHYLVLQVEEASAPDWFTVENWPRHAPYPVESVAGNLLSYPDFVDPAQDPRIEEMWAAQAQSHTVSKRDATFTVVADSITAHGAEMGWDFGFNVRGSAEAGVDLELFSATTKVEVEASYNHSEIHTRRTEVGNTVKFEANLGVLANTDGSYRVRPYIYRAKSGAVVLDYAVSPDWGDLQNPRWWDLQYAHHPDPAFRLPKLFHDEKHLDVTYPATKNWSPDIVVEPDSANAWETVTLSAVVHNYSLFPLDTPVDVRFYVGDPDGGRWGGDANGDGIEDNVGSEPIIGVGDKPFVTTVGSIPPRGSQTVTMDWVLPTGLPGNTWIYAVIDARGVEEVHDSTYTPSNNKGYRGLVTSGDPATATTENLPKHSYALGQNFPNPFNPSTSIHFILEKPGFTTLKVYDRAGRVVATLVNEELTTGKHVRQWSGLDGRSSQVASGVYFYRLQSGDFVQTKTNGACSSDMERLVKPSPWPRAFARGLFRIGEEASTTVDQTDIRGLVTALHFLRPGLPLSSDAGLAMPYRILETRITHSACLFPGLS